MSTENPIKHYLAQSVRTNGKWAFIAWISTLVVSIILVTIRVLPPVYNLIPFFMHDNFIFNTTPKFAPFAIPFVLLCSSQTHKEWQEANPDTPITKKEFATAIYLEIFLSIIIGVFTMGIIYIVAGLADPTAIEFIFTRGIHTLGVVVFWICLMTAMVYTLRFIPSKNKNLNWMVNLTTFSYVGALFVAARLQNYSHHLSNDVGIPLPVAVMGLTFVGWIVLVIGRTITAKLYERVDL